MKIVKIWKNGKTARPALLNIWVYQEIEGVPGSRIPYPGPGANLVTLTPPADNGDRWEKTIEGVYFNPLISGAESAFLTCTQ